MRDATKLYRTIKAIQGFILVVLGIVFCVFFQSDSMKNAISYCVASVLLVYAILTICFAYLFQRGIASTDMISGVVLTSISVFVFINPEIVTKFLPTLFGTILLTYSILLLIETVIYIVDKKTNYAVGFGLVAAIFLALGITIMILGNSTSSSDSVSDILVLIIGIILLIIGIFVSIYILIAPKREVIVNNSVVKTEEIDSSKVPANYKKPRKTQTKNKKSSEEQSSTDDNEVKQIEEK